MLQIPMVILSPGGDPKTRSQQLIMLESAVEIPIQGRSGVYRQAGSSSGNCL